MKTVKYKRFELKGGVILPVQSFEKEVPTASVKMYGDIFGKLLPLTVCERRLLDFLVIKMTPDNVVHTNLMTRNAFNNHIYRDARRIGKGRGVSDTDIDEYAKSYMYVDVTIRKAIGALVDYGFLVKYTRGVYYMNPEYFFKGSEQKRITKIEWLMSVGESDEDIQLTMKTHFDSNGN